MRKMIGLVFIGILLYGCSSNEQLNTQSNTNAPGADMARTTANRSTGNRELETNKQKLLKIGMAYLNQSKIPEAIRILNQAVLLDPGDPSPAFVLAQTYIHLKKYELAFDRRSYASPPEEELRIISSFMDCVGREIGFEKDLSKILGIALLGGTVGAGGMIGTSFVSANMTRREMIGAIAGSVAAGLGIGFAYENFKIKNGLNEALKNAGYLDRVYVRVSHS